MATWIGGFAGALAVSYVAAELAKPFVAVFLFGLGVYVLAPRWVRTRPACFSSSKMFSRDFSGISRAPEIRTPFERPGSSETANAGAARRA